ncbi:hypothetical protein TAO_0606 [Candidatus Nitrosoglobus terrae]|uniref:SGNH domain-containing protein n=2 Tax=Candidatus Nitrosoglobus terrae TaxID=1630141 RepID=A0A1Q2SLF5_9GAMM|nr:hypothetical protein TAO_0606 [Candidatus Nitrosoglobus terrae]
MIGVAYLSYRFFEQPMRRSKNNQKYILIFILITLIFSFVTGAKNTGGYPERQPEKVKNALAHFEKVEFKRLALAPAGLDFAGNEWLECNMRMPSTACRIDNRKLDLMIVGDSFASVFLYSFYELRDKINFAAYDYEECPLLSDPIWFGGHPECWEINKERWKVLEGSEPTNVLIGTKFQFFYRGKKSLDVFSKGVANLQDRVSSEFIYSSFRKSISKLIDLGYNVIILLHTPWPNIDVNQEMKRRISSGMWHFEDEYLGTSTYRMDMDVKKALEGIEGIKFIDMNKRMCNGIGKCLVFNRDGGLYNNFDHLSYYGAQLFIGDILALMK